MTQPELPENLSSSSAAPDRGTDSSPPMGDPAPVDGGTVGDPAQASSLPLLAPAATADGDPARAALSARQAVPEPVAVTDEAFDALWSAPLPAAAPEAPPAEPEDPWMAYWQWTDEPAPRNAAYVREVRVLLAGGRAMRADAHDLPVMPGDPVLVEGEEGLVSGKVTCYPLVRLSADGPLPRVVRREGKGDQRREEMRVSREEEAFRFCREKIHERNLDMKLVKVHCQHSGNKTIFYFGSESRVDFRSLVRDLAQRFHTRIEMRQIGVRDEARVLGGLGCCGLSLCCNAFLNGFAPVSIRMAKTQNLSLNPQKVSGQCGRLLCCLNYEQRVYEDLRRGLPKVGAIVETVRGPGKVKELDVLRRRVRVLLESGGMVVFQAVIEPPAEGQSAPERPVVKLVEAQGRSERGAGCPRRGNQPLGPGDLPNLGDPEPFGGGPPDEEAGDGEGCPGCPSAAMAGGGRGRGRDAGPPPRNNGPQSRSGRGGPPRRTATPADQLRGPGPGGEGGESGGPPRSPRSERAGERRERPGSNERPRDGNERPRDGNERPRDGNERPRDGNERPRDGERRGDGGERPRDGGEGSDPRRRRGRARTGPMPLPLPGGPEGAELRVGTEGAEARLAPREAGLAGGEGPGEEGAPLRTRTDSEGQHRGGRRHTRHGRGGRPGGREGEGGEGAGNAGPPPPRSSEPDGGGAGA